MVSFVASVLLRQQIWGSWFPHVLIILSIAMSAFGIFLLFTRSKQVKRQEIDQKESAELLRLIVEHSPTAVAVLDRDLRYLIASKRWIDDYGLDGSQLVGQSHYELFPEISDRWRGIFKVCLSGVVKRSDCDKLVRVDGSVLWIKWEIRPWRDSRNRVAGIMIFSEDITAIKVAEEQLQASETLTRSVVDGVVDGVITIDQRGHILSWNQAAERLFGYKSADVLGQNVKLIMPDMIAQQHDHYLAAYNNTGKSNLIGTVREVEGRRSDGTAVPIELSVSKTQIDGKAAFIGVTRDISDRRRADEERIARITADASNRAKSEFLANMSHEIRTPMNGIIGMTELALDTELTRQQRDYLSVVKASGSSLLTIINEVLDFSKIEAGKLGLELLPFDLRKTLAALLKALAPRAHEKGLELLCRVAPEVRHTLVGDAGRLAQILTNLLGNAIKFTTSGSVMLSVGQAPGSNVHECCLQFSVRDSGIGIPREMLSTIFDPFVQADLSTSRKFGGTGLGLPICRRLVEMMGGQISVTSESGHGSAFEFTAFMGLPSAVQVVGTPDLSGQTAIILDRHSDSGQIIAEQLRHWGAEVTVVTKMEHFLAAAPQLRPGLVIIEAAQLDAELTKDLLKQADLGPQAVVIPTLTFANRDVQILACEAADLTLFVDKPVMECDLADILLSPIDPPVIVKEQPRAEGSGVSRPLAVLLADDNRVNQLVAKEFLGRWGHIVTTAEDGEEALALIASQHFDVALLDLCMPKLDGFCTIAAIRASEHGSGRHLPCIALTAQAMAGDSDRCFAAGFDDYVSKPFDPQTLRQKLNSAVDRYSHSLKSKATSAAPADFSVTVFDIELALRNCAGNRTLLREILGLCQQSMQEGLRAFDAAVPAHDFETIARYAHKVLGSAGCIGARKVEALSRELDRLGRTHDAVGISATYAAFKHACDEFTEATRSIVEMGGSNGGGGEGEFFCNEVGR